jgi:hypothetical protein
LGITGEAWNEAGYHLKMNDEQSRTDAESRERSPDHQYTLTVDQVAEMYAAAGLPRTIRAIQKYCALKKLDVHRDDTETGGERYLVAPISVERHIAYIKEMRTVANGRDKSRTDATVLTRENRTEIETANDEQSRTDANVRDPDDRYVDRLESENEFLRGQIGVKDNTIAALLERDRETNVLIAGLQKWLTPLLGRPDQPPSGTS